MTGGWRILGTTAVAVVKGTHSHSIIDVDLFHFYFHFIMFSFEIYFFKHVFLIYKIQVF